MGTWGVSIAANDTVSDVRDFMLDRLKDGATLAEATAKAIANFRELDEDADEGPLLWLAIALVQWKYGSVDHAVLERVRHDIESERGLDLWRDEAKDLSKRKVALAGFLEKIQSANPKPASPPKIVVRRAPLEAGDCLVVQAADGRFTAALVLKTDNTNQEYGKNLVASLDYLESIPPPLAFFEERKWLFKRHGNWNGEQDINWYVAVRFKKESKRISVLGKTAIRKSDPQVAPGHCGWILLGHQILLCRASKS